MTDRFIPKLLQKSKRYEFSGDLPIYSAVHKSPTAADSDGNWLVWKYTYDGNSKLSLIQGPIRGSWNDRASLGWS